jgi:hypothetical protein
MKEDTPPTLECGMDDDQLEKYNAWVRRYGRSRGREQGEKFSAPCFLAGAMLIYFATKNQHKLPARWIFGTYDGFESSFDEPEENKEED